MFWLELFGAYAAGAATTVVVITGAVLYPVARAKGKHSRRQAHLNKVAAWSRTAQPGDIMPPDVYKEYSTDETN